MTVEESLEQFVERMYASGVARCGELHGCSANEIAALEKKYALVLPRSYSLFLSRMGHSAGKLGNLGEFDLSYADALKLTENEFDFWRRCSLKHPDYSAPAFPCHGLIFCARLAHPVYWLIVCHGQDDSPVFHFNYDEEPVRFEETEESLFGFLEELRRDAEHWIRRGTL